tara:strand:+ start:1067 stop:1567 length:501 start_codon:yes stop_codon:yes gene_type:complete
VRRIGVVAALLGACAGGVEPAPVADRDGGPAPTIEIQTGAPGEYLEFADGDEVLLQRGCQGSQHVFVSVRGRGFEGEKLEVQLELEREDDRTVVSLPLHLRLDFMEDAPVGVRQATGLTLVVPDPGDVVGERVVIRGTLVDPAGRTATQERPAVVRWGPDSCRGHG